MRYILIPIKDLTQAKQRLAGLMTPGERARLARAMCEQTLATVARARVAARVAVVTLDPPAIALAEGYGMEVIIEREQFSESASVDFGAREARRRGASAVLRLPLDLPLLTAEDIEALLARDRPGPSVVIAPSRDGTGTNAILRRPPELFPSHFGPGSLAQHLAEAERAGARCEVIHLPRVGLDIDDPEDVAEFMRTGAGTPIYDLLVEMRIDDRLSANNPGKHGVPP